MPRTRDVVILIVLCIFGALVSGVFLTTNTGEVERPEGEHTTPQAIFLVPHEAYDVVPYDDDPFGDSRDSFIRKVRDTYPKEKLSEETDAVLSAPTTEALPEETASTTYGDTHF